MELSKALFGTLGSPFATITAPFATQVRQKGLQVPGENELLLPTRQFFQSAGLRPSGAKKQKEGGAWRPDFYHANIKKKALTMWAIFAPSGGCASEDCLPCRARFHGDNRYWCINTEIRSIPKWLEALHHASWYPKCPQSCINI